MKTKSLFILIILSILFAVSASAFVDVTYHYNENNVDVMAYNCLDASCSTVSPWFETSTTNGEVTVIFPSDESTHGYALFHTTPGNVPIESRATWHSYGDDTHYFVDHNINFYQINSCHATIDSFTVTNDLYPHVPLIIDMDSNLDATTYSAFFLTNNDVAYVPEVLKDVYYSADTMVWVDIYNSEDELVYTDSDSFTAAGGDPIYADDSMNIHFEWIPEEVGTYTVYIYADVIDDQCATHNEDWSFKEFTVHPELPENECYTILNTLLTDNPFPVEGDAVEVSFDKISNCVVEGVYTPVETLVSYSVRNTDTDQIVFADTEVLPANPDEFDPTTHGFVWNADWPEWYVIEVNGIAYGSLADSLDNYPETISEFIYVKEHPKYDVTFHVIDSSDGTDIEDVEINMDSLTGMTDLDGYYTFYNLWPGTYDFDLTKPGYTPVSLDVDVIDYDQTIALVMNPINGWNNAPVITSTPVTNAYPDIDYEYDVNANDPDGDTLVYSLLEGPAGMIIDSATGLIEWMPELDQKGEEFDVVVEVSDGDLTDTQSYVIEVITAPSEKYPRRKIHIHTIRMNGVEYEYMQAGEQLMIDTSFENWGIYDIDSATIRVTIPELGISRRIGHFTGPEVKERLRKGILLDIPEDAEPGVYTLRMVITTNDLIKRVRHRDFRII